MSELHGYVPAQLFRDIAGVRQGDEQEAAALLPTHAQPAHDDPAQEPSGYAHANADSEPHSNGDPAHVRGPREQEHEQLVIARSCPRICAGTNREDALGSGAKDQPLGLDPKPLRRRALDVDSDDSAAGVADVDRLRRRCHQHGMRRRDGEGDPCEQCHSQRATTVYVTVAE